MIELATTESVIEAPVDDVFNYVSNMENYGAWFPGVIAIESKNNLSHGSVGKQYVERLNLPSGECDLIIEVAECEINRLFLTKGDFAGILPQMTVMFYKNDKDQCQIFLQYHSRDVSLLDKPGVVAALRGDLSIRAIQGIENLKNTLESKNIRE